MVIHPTRTCFDDVAEWLAIQLKGRGPAFVERLTICHDIVDNPKKILEFALVSGDAFSQGMATIAMAVFGTFADCEDVRRNLLRARSGK